MAKRKRERKRIEVSGRGEPASTSLASLLRSQGLPVRDAVDAEEARAPEPSAGPAVPDLASAGPLVLRRETKGRRGKTVTLLSGLGARAAEPLARVLGKALGCGASVREGDLVLQGDMRARAEAWLREQGAPSVERR